LVDRFGALCRIVFCKSSSRHQIDATIQSSKCSPESIFGPIAGLVKIVIKSQAGDFSYEEFFSILSLVYPELIWPLGKTQSFNLIRCNWSICLRLPTAFFWFSFFIRSLKGGNEVKVPKWWLHPIPRLGLWLVLILFLTLNFHLIFFNLWKNNPIFVLFPTVDLSGNLFRLFLFKRKKQQKNPCPISNQRFSRFCLFKT